MEKGKKKITVLWLDDVRNPLKYLNKKPEAGNKIIQQNQAFYKRFLSRYDVSFVWVKTLKEFKAYIEENGLPDFVSFDRDLGPNSPKGEVVAAWLVRYCKKNNLKLPKYYAHTANWRGKEKIDKVMAGKLEINIDDIQEAVQSVVEKLLDENVTGHAAFLDRTTADRNNKTINITYNNTNNRNLGVEDPSDMLRTDKMDNKNPTDVYLVRLKNGFESYNITSIKGEEVMHYFKRLWDNKKTTAKVKDGDKKEDYTVKMDDRQRRMFLSAFLDKLKLVIGYHMRRMENENPDVTIKGISIYPVKSSSNFNDKVAELIAGLQIDGLTIQKLSQEMFVKDLRNINIDSDFVKKNKGYYDSDYLKKGNGKRKPNRFDGKSVYDMLNATYMKLDAINRFNSKLTAKKLNAAKDEVLKAYKKAAKKLGKTILEPFESKYELFSDIPELEELYDAYKKYCEILFSASNIKYGNSKVYFSTSNNRNGKREYSVVEPVGDDDELTMLANKIWKKYGKKIESMLPKEVVLDIARNGWKYLLRDWKPAPFQIKKLTNGVRMGLKGVYNPNSDSKFFEQERKKALGTAMVIFDDNVSGGATLSDICNCCKEAGIQVVIPITFGRMDEKWSAGRSLECTIPIDDNGKKGFNY